MSRRPAKVSRLVKRARIKVIHKLADPERVFARKWMLEPDPGRPFKVELRIARTRHLMHTEALRLHNRQTDLGPDCRGAVCHFRHRMGEAHRVLPGQRICIMYLNARDIQDDGANIIAHECAHAGLAYARNRRANLDSAAGEEVAAYAVGYLSRQICNIAHKMHIW